MFQVTILKFTYYRSCWVFVIPMHISPCFGASSMREMTQTTNKTKCFNAIVCKTLKQVEHDTPYHRVDTLWNLKITHQQLTQ